MRHHEKMWLLRRLLHIIYMTSPHCNLDHLIHIQYIQYILILLCYPDGFLYNIPNILDVCSLNQIGSLHFVSKHFSQVSADPSPWLQNKVSLIVLDPWSIQAIGHVILGVSLYSVLDHIRAFGHLKKNQLKKIKIKISTVKKEDVIWDIP